MNPIERALRDATATLIAAESQARDAGYTVRYRLEGDRMAGVEISETAAVAQPGESMADAPAIELPAAGGETAEHGPSDAEDHPHDA